MGPVEQQIANMLDEGEESLARECYGDEAVDSEWQRRNALPELADGSYCMRHGTPGQFCSHCADEAEL